MRYTDPAKRISMGDHVFVALSVLVGIAMIWIFWNPPCDVLGRPQVVPAIVSILGSILALMLPILVWMSARPIIR
ncbi:hypothetical protein [Sphingomonas melonis]|uniref:hypothetical protein n=1 Tax=Sphingomonas melonis TaxID=152682 RepID=UPI0035C7B3CD